METLPIKICISLVCRFCGILLGYIINDKLTLMKTSLAHISTDRKICCNYILYIKLNHVQHTFQLLFF